MSRLLTVLLSILLTAPATVVWACPNPDMNATVQVRTNGAALRMGTMRRALAGGNSALDTCPSVTLPDVPAMLFPDAPSMTADLGGMLGLAMEITSDATCPTGLLVRTADGDWYHDDSGRGPGQPRIMLRHPGSGPLMIWIGTPDGGACRATVRLVTYAG
ncbi:hypothetical protein ACOI1H_09325 [Loktanella sp. DJP18]|uniref:hypothetical protein n=1 Tax=Loktanella sp. DJP18 TaxID=3409788 RepID=UPI003BB56A58